MKRLEKAQKQLESNDITTEVTNSRLYVYIGDYMLELSNFEVSFQANLFNDKNN